MAVESGLTSKQLPKQLDLIYPGISLAMLEFMRMVRD